MHWLDGLSSKLLQTRDATRLRITAESDSLSLEVQRLHDELAAAHQEIESLNAENASLRVRLGLV
jgi:hypothetical protein